MHRVLLLPLSFPSLATCLRNLWPFTVGRTDRLKPSAPCLRASDHSTRPAAKPRGNCMDYWFQSGCGAAPRLRTIGCACVDRRADDGVPGQCKNGRGRAPQRTASSAGECELRGDGEHHGGHAEVDQAPGQRAGKPRRQPGTAQGQRETRGSTRWPRRACKRPVPVAARRACRSAPRYPGRHVG